MINVGTIRCLIIVVIATFLLLVAVYSGRSLLDEENGLEVSVHGGVGVVAATTKPSRADTTARTIEYIRNR
jgi:hypothetical protein